MSATVATNKIRSLAIVFAIVFEFENGLNNLWLYKSDNSMCLNKK